MRNMIDEQYRTNVCKAMVDAMIITLGKEYPLAYISPEEFDAWKEQTEMMFFRAMTKAYNSGTEEKEHLTGSD